LKAAWIILVLPATISTYIMTNIESKLRTCVYQHILRAAEQKHICVCVEKTKQSESSLCLLRPPRHEMESSTSSNFSINDSILSSLSRLYLVEDTINMCTIQCHNYICKKSAAHWHKCTGCSYLLFLLCTFLPSS